MMLLILHSSIQQYKLHADMRERLHFSPARQQQANSFCEGHIAYKNSAADSISSKYQRRRHSRRHAQSLTSYHDVLTGASSHY